VVKSPRIATPNCGGKFLADLKASKDLAISSVVFDTPKEYAGEICK
jgi:hypothetical protein